MRQHLNALLDRCTSRPGWRLAADLWGWMCAHPRLSVGLTAVEGLLVAFLIRAAIQGSFVGAWGCLVALMAFWGGALALIARQPRQIRSHRIVDAGRNQG